jgi:hypothetical protein
MEVRCYFQAAAGIPLSILNMMVSRWLYPYWSETRIAKPLGSHFMDRVKRLPFESRCWRSIFDVKTPVSHILGSAVSLSIPFPITDCSIHVVCKFQCMSLLERQMDDISKYR